MGLCCVTGQQRVETWRGLCRHMCQALTVRRVKLVIISSLKPCPAACSSLLWLPPAWGEASDRTLKQDVPVREVNLCRDGVANIMARLYRHRLVWHIRKRPNKFVGWRRCDGRLWRCNGITARWQMFVWPLLQETRGLKDRASSGRLVWIWFDSGRPLL